MSDAQYVRNKLKLAAVGGQDGRSQCMHIQGQTDHKKEHVARQRREPTHIWANDSDASDESDAQSKHGMDPRPKDVNV
jgi:hypothetical protein